MSRIWFAGLYIFFGGMGLAILLQVVALVLVSFNTVLALGN